MNLGSKFGFSRFGPAIRMFLAETGSKFGLFGEVRMGLKFSFGGRTWVRVSSKFDLSGSKFVIFGFDPTLIRVNSSLKENIIIISHH